MITNDIDIANNIFYILNSGITNGYDSFEYTVEIYDDYIEEEAGSLSQSRIFVVESLKQNSTTLTKKINGVRLD